MEMRHICLSSSVTKLTCRGYICMCVYIYIYIYIYTRNNMDTSLNMKKVKLMTFVYYEKSVHVCFGDTNN